MPPETNEPDEIDPLEEACRRHIKETGSTIYGHIWYSHEEQSRNAAAKWLAEELRAIEKILWPMNEVVRGVSHWDSTTDPDAAPPGAAEIGDIWATPTGTYMLSEGRVWVDLMKPPTDPNNPDTD